jgi:hypothetical protein
MKIVSRFDGRTLYECDAETMLETLHAAVKAKADLSGADLSGADLRGHKVTTVPLTIGPIGSRSDYTYFWPTEDGVFVKCGCFFDTIAFFRQKVAAKHGENKYGRDYAAAIAFVEIVLTKDASATKAETKGAERKHEKQGRKLKRTGA